MTIALSQVDQLSKFGFSFTPLRDKRPLLKDWANKPQGAFDAKKALKRGCNVGVLAGKWSDKIIWFDLDVNFSEFLAANPRLKQSLIVTRPNALERGKVAVKLTDQLPHSASWKSSNPNKPDAELLSTGRQAAIIGMHESGVAYQSNGQEPIELTFADVSAIWRKWTGQELRNPTLPPADPTPVKNYLKHSPHCESEEQRADDLRDKVKAAWTSAAVFEHHKKETGKGHYTKVSRDGSTWFDNSLQCGGDCVAAWALCTRDSEEIGDSLQGYVRKNFRNLLSEMAKAAGIEFTDKRQPSTVRIGDRDVLVSEAIKQAVERYTDMDVYPKHERHVRTVDPTTGEITEKTQKYANRTDRLAMLTVLSLMQRADKLTVTLSCREFAELMNCNFVGASRKLRLLCKAGFIKRVDGESWFTGSIYEGDYEDQAIVNANQAFTYTLNLEVCNIATQRSERATASLCSDTAHLDLSVKTINDYADNALFAHAAKEGKDLESFGRSCLDLVAALVANNDLCFADIAEATGMSRTTVSKKASVLADAGILEVYTEEGKKHCHLVDCWQELIQKMNARVNAYLRNARRKISHLHQRIQRIFGQLALVTSAELHKALLSKLDKYLKRMDKARAEKKDLIEFRDQVASSGWLNSK